MSSYSPESPDSIVLRLIDGISPEEAKVYSKMHVTIYELGDLYLKAMQGSGYQSESKLNLTLEEFVAEQITGLSRDDPDFKPADTAMILLWFEKMKNEEEQKNVDAKNAREELSRAKESIRRTFTGRGYATLVEKERSLEERKQSGKDRRKKAVKPSLSVQQTKARMMDLSSSPNFIQALKSKYDIPEEDPETREKANQIISEMREEGAFENKRGKYIVIDEDYKVVKVGGLEAAENACAKNRGKIKVIRRVV
ncbi:hypothetical protein GF340_04970 [Candidatus Peregrinibacteria bacterium]|nr:hypothetical protein [Candidatus Peregrinibacteria bacterium]